MPTQPDKETQDSARDPAEYAQVLDTVPESEPAPKQDTVGEFLFQIFCAVIFLGMIGLVFYNAMLRYLFSSSYPPSEEWARFLFIYITFFGSIEAFYRKKHIAVDMFVDMLHGVSRKTVEIIASLVGMAVVGVLLWGGVVYVMSTYDQESVSTGVNMTFIYGTLPIMAAAALIIQLRDFIALLRRPVSEFEKA
ncbi:TRAP transporter small permease [uncultured Desulfovibrio sp.]|uniref:TRAP transporter small permease n=1 Tax=uncultured Desulfovibrio sp. TaxID=167968 RepID=UPI0025D3EBC7|nr:TRAP transporter small permease [uncultured Desulfovibrio sp.]